MNFLFVSCEIGLLSHIDCGAAQRSTMLIKALAKIGHVDVITFHKETIYSTVQNCDVIYSKHNNPTEPPSLKNRLIRITNLLFRPWHPYGYYRLDKTQEAVVDRLYGQKKYDFVVCRYISWTVSCGLMKYADKLIVDVDDNPFVELKSVYDYGLNISPLIKYVVKWKIKHVNEMTKWILDRVKLSYYSNFSESPSKQSVFLHNVSTLRGNRTTITDNTPLRILVVGLLDYYPNQYGVTHFACNIFPMIKEKVPSAELHIVGRSRNKELIEMLGAVKGVKVLGFVEDIEKEYINSRVVVVPIYHGSGSCVKFIEAMMMSRPVVSAPYGARGFDMILKPDQHFLMAESDQAFADKVTELLLSLEMGNKLASDAFQVAFANFSQEKFFDIVKESILRL